MFEIKNNEFIVEVSEKAAEVHSFKRINEEYNYVWKGDSNYWAGRNPILFPQVGSNSEKTIKVDGVKYKTSNHGFARNEVFKLISKGDDELVLGLKENDSTLAQYPFRFELLVKYKLIDNRLDITYTIKNNDDKVMPFGFGLHPAFACSHDYKDTKVVFNVEEECGRELIINSELFDKYPTYEIYNPKATKASLYTNDRIISIEYVGFKIFAIWSKGDFVCLEPWFNHCPSDPEIELKDREGSLFLNPNESINIKYSWIIEK